MRRTISSLDLTDFRNYERLSLEAESGLTLLVGPNGVGKTNVIEAICLVTRGESFRTSSWQEVVRWGAEAATVVMQAEDDRGGRSDVRLTVTGGRRAYRVNGTARRRVSDATGAVPAVVFTPEDLRVVKDSADKRRQMLDSLGSQISPSYAAARAEYERILRQRNALLRAGDAPEQELEPWTDRIIHKGAELRRLRVRLLDGVSGDLAEAYSRLAGQDDLGVLYQQRDRELPGPPDREGLDSAVEEMRKALTARSREERARGTSLVGPHRDDVSFLLGGRDARPFASQGQQRSIALAWKLAEVNAIERALDTTPVLLLDDVMSELDEERRRRLSALVAERTQTFVTTTNLGYFDPDFVKAAKVVVLS